MPGRESFIGSSSSGQRRSWCADFWHDQREGGGADTTVRRSTTTNPTSCCRSQRTGSARFRERSGYTNTTRRACYATAGCVMYRPN